jgi:uncharacterized membrane protein YdfJ with MMPL/SSD domain
VEVGDAGVDNSLPTFAFIFLVALGIDYTIFLMSRVREEARRWGTREGMLRALVVRTIMVPAAVELLGDRIWWPSGPGGGAHALGEQPAPEEPAPEPAAAG